MTTAQRNQKGRVKLRVKNTVALKILTDSFNGHSYEKKNNLWACHFKLHFRSKLRAANILFYFFKVFPVEKLWFFIFEILRLKKAPLHSSRIREANVRALSARASRIHFSCKMLFLGKNIVKTCKQGRYLTLYSKTFSNVLQIAWSFKTGFVEPKQGITSLIYPYL
jgi:hypothetical protein